MATTRTGERSSHRLRERSLDAPHVIFQSITHGAPAVSLAFSIIVLVPIAGPAIPFTLVLAMIAVLLVAVAMGQLGKEMPSAGGLYTYAAGALGPRAGFVVGWLYLIFEPWLMPLLLLLGAQFLQSFVQTEFHVNTGWVLWVFVIGAAIFVLTYRNIRVSMTAGIALAVFEVGSFLALGIWMVIAHHDQNTLQAFNPASAPGNAGTSILKSMVFAVVAFIGFEGAASLGEEAKDGRRAVPKALIIGVLSIAVFYIFMTYSWVVGTGFRDFVSVTTSSSNPFYDLARKFWGAGWIIIFFGLMTGIFGNANAGMTTGSRLMFAMGRNGALPAVLGRTHPRFHTPSAGIIVNTVFGIAVTLLLGSTIGIGQGVGFVGIVIGMAGISMYILMCISCLVFYLRKRRDKFNFWLHGVIPVLGAAAFIAPIYYQYVPLVPFPLRWALIFDPVWIILGFAVMAWLEVRRPGVLGNGAQLFGAELPETGTAVTAAPGEAAPGLPATGGCP
jgi:amino acid transporter